MGLAFVADEVLRTVSSTVQALMQAPCPRSGSAAFLLPVWKSLYRLEDVVSLSSCAVHLCMYPASGVSLFHACMACFVACSSSVSDSPVFQKQRIGRTGVVRRS